MDNSKKKKLKKLLAEISPEDRDRIKIDDLEDSLKNLSDSLSSVGSSVKSVQPEIIVLSTELNLLKTELLTKLHDFSTKYELNEIKAKYADILDIIEEQIDSIKGLDRISQNDLDKLKEENKEELNRLNNKLERYKNTQDDRGGSARTDIRFNSSVSSQYIDLNFVNSSTIGWNTSNDNVNKRVNVTASLLAGGGSGGANPAGVGSEIQFRLNSSTFGAVPNSSVVGSVVTLGTLDLINPLNLADGGWGLGGNMTIVSTTGTINALTVSTNFIRMAATATTTVNGITNNGTAQRITILCLGVGVTFTHQSGSASAANRIFFAGSANLFVPANSTITFIYDTTQGFWVMDEFRSPIATNNATTTQNLYSTMSGTPAGTNNVVFGNEATSVGTFSGSGTIVIGYRAGRSLNGSPVNAVIVGATTGLVATGSNNTLLGSNSASVLSTGTSNVILGPNNVNTATTATTNIAIGTGVLPTLTTGSNNIAIGNTAGVNHGTGSNNISIGTSTGSSSSSILANAIAIGNTVRNTASNQMLLGGTTNPVVVGINNNSPVYRLDVGGDINVSSGSVYRINGVAQSPWLLTGNSGTSPGTNFVGTTDYQDFQVKTNNTLVQVLKATGITGWQQSTPTATGHFGILAGTVSAPTGFSSGIAGLVSSGGYAFGSGNKSYTIRSLITVSGTTVYSSATLGGTFTDPGSGVLNPSGGSATSQNGSGYDPNSVSPPSYEVWSLFTGDTTQGGSTGSFQTDGGTWADTSQNKDVSVSWSGSSLGGESNYYVLRNGTDFRVVSGPFLDDNTGWSPGGAPGNPSPNYTVSVSWTAANGAESYNAFNTTTTKWTNVASSPATDDDTWTAGTPTSTPTTADYDTLKSDGNNRFDKKFIEYNNVNTAGWGVPAIYGSGRSTAQTAAVATVATYTVGSSDGSFEISANVNVTTSTAHNFTVTCAYTDEGNTARTLTLGFTQLSGATFITAITNVTGAGPYESPVYHIRCKASTAITIATTGTFTTVTYNVEGVIKQIA